MTTKSKRASAHIVSPVLKCKKGDMAYNLLPGRYLGIVVDVVEYAGTVRVSNSRESMTNAWRVSHKSDEPGVQYFIEDHNLLPIRPGDLQETVTDELALEGGAQ